MSFLDTYRRQATLLDRPRASGRRMRIVSDWVHPDLVELVGKEQRRWGQQMRAVKAAGVPTAGLGFTGPVQPNIEPVANLTAVTGVTAETNLYTPATTTNAAFALLPIGSMRAGQAFRIFAGGVVTSTAAGQTVAITSRLGSSATPSSNASLGATGAIALGSTITNALWWYEGHMTIRTVGAGTAATAVNHANIQVGQQAAGSSTSANTGLSGNTTASFDSTIQQGFVISVTPSAAGVSVTLTQFLLVAWD